MVPKREFLALILLLAAPGIGWASETITVSSGACAAVAALTDAPGVAYQPGVDANGERVAPADLPGTTNDALARKLAATPVEITINLRRRFGIPANAALFRGRAEVGDVTVKDGRAYLDDVPLSPAEQSLLLAACDGRGRR